MASHVDGVPCFSDTVASLSLGPARMIVFTRLRADEAVPVFVEPGSLVVMHLGDAAGVSDATNRCSSNPGAWW